MANPRSEHVTPIAGESGNLIPPHRLQRYLARFMVGVALVSLVAFKLFGSIDVHVVVDGDSTIYTESSSLEWFRFLLPIMAAILAFAYLLQSGMYRLFGVALALTSIWTGYMAYTLDTSNHNVTVTPTSVTREIGTPSNPIKQQIDFTSTAYLFIDDNQGTQSPEYELVANASTSGAETRIPIFAAMKAALPLIMENAGKNNVTLGETADGWIIPPVLRVGDDLAKNNK